MTTQADPVLILGSGDSPGLAAMLADLAVIEPVGSVDECWQRWPDGDVAVLVVSEGDEAHAGADARTLRGHERWGHVPVVFVVEREPGEASLEAMYALGAVDHVVRPVAAAVLRAKVSGLVAASRRAHEEGLRAAEERREQDQHRDEFLATLAHELRNPLAPLRTGLEAIRRLPPDDPAVARVQGIMGRQLDHMVHLIDDLLDVSRLSRGKVELRRERVTAQAVIELALEGIRPLVEGSRHSLTVRVPDAPLWLDGDLTRLAQVMGNLLHNAIKYTPEGGHLELSAGAMDGEVVLRMTDDGGGIAAEMLPRVFDLFTQVDRTINRAHGGLGIGLALARKLLALHGGALEAASPGPGRGSTFTVRLPLAEAPAAPAATAPAATAPAASPEAPDASGGRRRILVVDDNEDAAELLSMVLERQGHDTRTAFSGPDALALVGSFRPEVIFLDIGMPEMNGYEVAQRLRADPAQAGVTLVALTGWGAAADKQRTREAGFDVHLTKPVSTVAIDEIVGPRAGRRP